MRLDILAKILQDANAGVIGQSIFAHQMPPECQEGILLKLPLSGVKVDHYLPNYYDSEVQLIVRAQTQSRGDFLVDLAVPALKHLQTKDYLDQPGNKFAIRINHLLPKNLPIRFPRSDGNGIEWSVNFCANYVMAP